MDDRADVFEKHYEEYLARLAGVDLDSVADRLGLLKDEGQVYIMFYGERYAISASGITDESGRATDYPTAVILCQYILGCPSAPHPDQSWVSFKDFKAASHFTNVNFFASDTERALAKAFAGRLKELRRVCVALGGVEDTLDLAYDCIYQFRALPRVELLLLFNDGDDEFPAQGSVLFWAQAEQYLDPESLAMTSAALIRRLRDASA